MRAVIPFFLFAITILVSGCINFEQLPTSRSSDEEICLSMKTDSLKNHCLSYINDDPDYCQEYGCFILASKLMNEDICTNNHHDEECISFVTSIKNGKDLDSELKKRLELSCRSYRNPLDIQDEEEGDCSSLDICDIQNNECYGSCDVRRHSCINSVAAINNKPEFCDLPQATRHGGCYYNVGSYNKNIEMCNKITSSIVSIRDRCYLNVITDRLEMKYGYISGTDHYF